MPECFRAFPADTWGVSPVMAVVDLTTSLQPWGGALPRAEPNLGLSDPGKCIPLASGGLFSVLQLSCALFPLAGFPAVALGAEISSQSHFTAADLELDEPHRAFICWVRSPSPGNGWVMPREAGVMNIF